MNEEFGMVKSELDATDDLNDIWNNPVVQGIYQSLKVFPVITTLTGTLISDKLLERQKQKQAELCRIIFNDNSISLEDVEDVLFITEFARTLDVVNKLSTNEKIQYIAKLFKKTFSSNLYKENLSEFEEYLRKLEYVSIRELKLLFLLYECEQVSGTNAENDSKKMDKDWKKFKIKANDIYGIGDNMIVSIMSGLTMTGFCRESNIMFPGGAENPYYITPYFVRFLDLIQ